MVTIEQVIEWCEKQGLRYAVHFNTIAIGGETVKDQDVSSFRSDFRKEAKQDIWYPKYDLRFSTKTREITDFGSGEFDIRKDADWSL